MNTPELSAAIDHLIQAALYEMEYIELAQDKDLILDNYTLIDWQTWRRDFTHYVHQEWNTVDAILSRMS